MLTREEFLAFRELIHRHTGIFLADAKHALVNARLRRRLLFHNLDSFTDYYRILIEEGVNGGEFREMINCITTNKTDFFREPHHFEFVRDVFLPEMQHLASVRLVPRKIRVWHAGCSTGEEPYTMGMTLMESLANFQAWDVRQLASDIDTNVLDFAEAGIYDQERIDKVPETLRQRYFMKGKGKRDGLYKVVPPLRSLVTFRQINLLADQWPIRSDVRFDVIFCRNVMIYFDKPTQKKLLERFSSLLRPGGYLLIGHSESMLGLSDRYESLGKTIYRLARTNALVEAA
ncbi:MAG TPA: protein-glutamate O-methyltransferase CheR [Fimbriimonadaceae bacterium]|nr:protein-glutamate O-methyltransferase CheR [Fimbriimonadaceae bacterium]